MMRVTILILLLSSLTVWAVPTQILVKTELLINGKVVASPRMQVLAGEKAFISQRGKKDLMTLRILASPTTDKGDEFFLDMDLQYQNGDKQIHSKPQVFAKAGTEAIMTLEESTKGEKVQLRVLAKEVAR